MKALGVMDPEILGGEAVFAGTRVPVKSLFDHLEGGETIDDFLEGFPGVSREHVMAVLEESLEEICTDPSLGLGIRGKLSPF